MLNSYGNQLGVNRTLILFALLCWMASDVRAQGFDPAKVGPTLSNAPAELYLPPGVASIGAVVVLHGCNGVGPHDREWARRLAGWGFAALLIDSFSPRATEKSVITAAMCRPRRGRATPSMAPPICAPRPRFMPRGSA